VCRKYSIERRTSRFAINYYVRPDFEESFVVGTLELSRLERQVEDEYIANLQHNCYRERSYRKCQTCLVVCIITAIRTVLHISIIRVKETSFQWKSL